MPKPVPRAYDPRSLGADCDNCPLACKGMLPVPPHLNHGKAKAVIVIEHPSPQSKYSGTALEGRASDLLLADLGEAGLGSADLSAVYRIACCPPPNKTTDSILGRAAKACRPRVEAELAECQGPRLYLGKWSPKGIFPRGDFPERVEIAMARNVWHRSSMVLTHPSIAYFHAPARRAQFKQDLGRFARLVRGDLVWPGWPMESIFIEHTEQTLHALRNMGPVIAYDAETLGTDPLTAPITAIGISDGEKTVCVGWATYENRFGRHQGIADGGDPLDVELKAAVREVLESDRSTTAQNGNYDILAMENIGISTRVDFDTLDASKILDPELPGGLEEAGVRYLVLPDRWKSKFRSGRDQDEKGSNEFADSHALDLRAYCARDTLVTWRLREIQEKLLAEED